MTTIDIWTHTSLLSKGYRLLNTLEDVQTTPWSSVKRVLTTHGYVYLKMPGLLNLESEVIQILHEKCLGNVPHILDRNNDLNCFLMKDGGKPFYHFKNHDHKITLILEIIRKYKYIQTQSQTCIDMFFKLGVPDWRLKTLPNLYSQLIHKDQLLIEDGLSLQEISELANLQSQCKILCDQLSEYHIPETLDHCDLHGGNVLLDEIKQTITIIDWGETVITHPFLSLTVFLRCLVNYYEFEEKELWDACFENNECKNKSDLQKIVALVQKLEPVYSALAFQRLLLSSDKEKFMSAPNCKGRITKYLREFILSSKK